MGDAFIDFLKVMFSVDLKNLYINYKSIYVILDNSIIRDKTILNNASTA